MNVAGILACLSDTVEFQNISNGEVNASASSKAEFKELAEIGAKAFKSRRQTVIEHLSAGPLTLIRISYEAVVAADLPNGWKAGDMLSFTGSSAFETADGYITRIIDES